MPINQLGRYSDTLSVSDINAVSTGKIKMADILAATDFHFEGRTYFVEYERTAAVPEQYSWNLRALEHKKEGLFIRLTHALFNLFGFQSEERMTFAIQNNAFTQALKNRIYAAGIFSSEFKNNELVFDRNEALAAAYEHEKKAAKNKEQVAAKPWVIQNQNGFSLNKTEGEIEVGKNNNAIPSPSHRAKNDNAKVSFSLGNTIWENRQIFDLLANEYERPIAVLEKSGNTLQQLLDPDAVYACSNTDRLFFLLSYDDSKHSWVADYGHGIALFMGADRHLAEESLPLFRGGASVTAIALSKDDLALFSK